MIRKAAAADIPALLDILRACVQAMQAEGNDQWDESYPQRKDFLADIAEETLFVFEQDRSVAGFVCINRLEPAAYAELSWSLGNDYLVLHRLAVSPLRQKSGIAWELLRFAEDLAREQQILYLKTDTNSMNRKAQGLLKKSGYRYVGEVRFRHKEKPFYCYEKLLEPEGSKSFEKNPAAGKKSKEDA